MTAHTRRLTLFAAMLAATVVAPLAAPISVLLAVVLREGSAEMVLFAPLILVTIPGLYGLALASFAVLLLGPLMTALSLRFPALRPKRIWLAAGAFFGILLGLAFTAYGRDMLVYGAIAGSACALTYRLIVGPALLDCAALDADIGMETR